MEASQIRVDATLLGSNQGKLVRLIGKVKSFNPSTGVGTVDSNGDVTVILNLSENSIQIDHIYEFIGKIGTSDLDVTVYSSVEFSENTNLEVAQKLVSFVHKVPELYY
ncbi:replication factor A protein 3 [Scheffersomyces amazonensis]|uniref:replication factor A protein 3 n=1 Tax=Scheffersomyces amazonensis TaxID=1078765 RepID=UPI00315C6E0D